MCCGNEGSTVPASGSSGSRQTAHCLGISKVLGMAENQVTVLEETFKPPPDAVRW